jgi:GTP-binding protein HflX
VEPDKMIFALNKSDLIKPDKVIENTKYLKLDETNKWISISAVTGKNILELKDLIGRMLELEKFEMTKKPIKAELD